MGGRGPGFQTRGLAWTPSPPSRTAGGGGRSALGPLPSQRPGPALPTTGPRSSGGSARHGPGNARSRHSPSSAGSPRSLCFSELRLRLPLRPPLQALRLLAPPIVTEHPLLAWRHAGGQGTTGHQGQAGCGAVCVPGTLPRAQPGVDTRTLPPPSPPGLCTCCRMSLSHCFVWLTPTWLMSPPLGSQPGFLSHSGFTNCFLCPCSLPEKRLLGVCFCRTLPSS